ncbi:MAG: hypothetical protein GC178_15575 [Flavobacteriales bacterium]|nr:hypothetical protein [Flavobacteriales bacterium]
MHPQEKPKHMRLFLIALFTIFTTGCQAQNYGGWWQEVDQYTNDGRPKSALEVVRKIHDQAVKDGNGPQLVKAVIHEIKFQSEFEEESLVASIIRLEDEAKTAPEPTKQILHSLLAEMNWGYYQNNSWQIHNRTATETAGDNILTWDFKRIAEEADKHYRLSLENAEVLKSAALKDYEAILTGSDKYRELRPSLYHLLLSRALDFYSSEERELINFDPSGIYNDPKLLGSVDEFLTWEAPTKSGLQPAAYSIHLYQELLREAQKLGTEAMVSEDLKRLNFIYGRSQAQSAHKDYTRRLQQLVKEHAADAVSGEAAYYLALLYHDQGSAASDPSHPARWNWKTADSICQVYIQKFPNSLGARNCTSLSERIRQRDWSMAAEQHTLAEKPFRFLFNYRNIGDADADKWTVYTQVAKLDPIEYRENARSNYGEKLINWLKSHSQTVSEKSFQVPNPGDFREHSIELPLEGLPIGTYVIFTGSDSKLSTNKDVVSYAIVTVTDLALISRSENDGETVLKVVSRDSGKPIAQAKIELLSLVYNRKTRSNDYQLEQTLTTDQNGQAVWKGQSQNYRGYVVDVYHGEDKLIGADNVFGYSNREDIRWNDQTHFFLDRAIYRPGQTIHFKGIMLSSNGKEVKTLTDKNTTMKLFDANGQEVSSLNLKSNGFGTFSGTFIAPTGGLNGMIRIGNESGSHSFRMEEYKRPKFEVKVDQPKEQYRVNDTVSVSGTAMSYSGVPLDGAEVKYRVTRMARFPFPWLCWGWMPQSQPKQVAFGTVTTDASGVFQTEFEAQPDPLIKATYKPVFNYQIEVDVTDQSGEMQTGNTSVSVGYHALNIDIDVPAIIEKKELGKYTVSATNLSGEKQPAEVSVDVWKLIPNERILRKRLWQTPDQFYLSESEFKRMFRNEPYKNEGDHQTWEKDKNMYHAVVKTAQSGEVNFAPLNGLGQGYYLVELTAKDAFGTEVIQKEYYNLVDATAKVPPYFTTAWFHTLKDNYEPGETLELLVGSSYAFVDFKIEVEVKDKGFQTNKIIYTKGISCTGTQQKLEIPVTEEWRGNAQIHITTVRNNELLSWSKTISVPYTNKQLDVKLETFRKEMAPDDAEEWTVSIKDMNGKPAKAEFLTTMYDASLDVLAANNWGLSPYHFLNVRYNWNSNSFGQAQTQIWNRNWMKYPSSTIDRDFEQIDWFGYYFGGRNIYLQSARNTVYSRGRAAEMFGIAEEAVLDEVQVVEYEAPLIMKDGASPPTADKVSGDTMISDNSDSATPKDIRMRSDFSETVFFNPHLVSDEKGNVSFKFNAPQSLTRWKFMGLATTEDLKIGTITEEVVTRKQLMITPNYPRFVREGDKLIFQVKVNVLDSSVTKASASLELQDALTGEPLKLPIANRQLSIANGSAVASWEINIPEGISAIKFTTKAWSDNHSDGEEKTIPVLPNRMLVTESMPLPVRGKGTHTFSFDKLKHNTSSTLRNHSLTLEFTPNPIWLAVLSLPYMMEYPYECSEQIFSRYYANAIGTHLANSDPKIKAVFEQWKRDAQNKEGDAFQSELDKNPELKQALLTETPWVRDAQNETEQRRRIGELFDTDRMETELQAALKKLKQNQQPDGGWGWFNGLRSDMYITRYIVSGFGKMRKMSVWQMDGETESMLREAIVFLDEEMVKFYDRRDLKDKDYMPSWTDLHMTYARSFWLDDFALNGKAKTTYNLIVKNIRDKWTKLDASQKGLAAVVLKRSGFEDDAKKVIVSLRETALTSEEFGTYWAMDKGYYWYQAPIENHVMILEAFDEVANDADMVREMNIWLLKQKQTQSWETTKATAEACYALISTGNTDFETEAKVSIKLGNETIDPRTDPDLKTEAGTGYFKTNWTKSSVDSEMGNVTVTKDNDGVAWGAVYWKYFEDLDKTTGATDNPIKMERDVMLLEDTENGPVMKPLGENTSLSVGDRVRVRIVLETDRHMEYVHLKDMRAASFEPRKQLSGVEFQEGLSYYRSTTDAAMNFFFSYLPKGTFVFEYDLNVTQAGTFSNGISQLQCMYAPEFTTHSEGVRLEVDK